MWDHRKKQNDLNLFFLLSQLIKLDMKHSWLNLYVNITYICTVYYCSVFCSSARCNLWVCRRNYIISLAPDSFNSCPDARVLPQWRLVHMCFITEIWLGLKSLIYKLHMFRINGPQYTCVTFAMTVWAFFHSFHLQLFSRCLYHWLCCEGDTIGICAEAQALHWHSEELVLWKC